MRTAGHVVGAELKAIENQEDWATLHDELGSLPQSFREPLILCYLDGLTQEQAAAQLRCPLGTIQSRLARGRAKLKARLEKRGVGLVAAFGGADHLALQSPRSPAAWVEATVRLAMPFAQGNSPTTAGASAAAVVLAEKRQRVHRSRQAESRGRDDCRIGRSGRARAAWAIAELRVNALR